jgi:hypothetical protein
MCCSYHLHYAISGTCPRTEPVLFAHFVPRSAPNTLLFLSSAPCATLNRSTPHPRLRTLFLPQKDIVIIATAGHPCRRIGVPTSATPHSCPQVHWLPDSAQSMWIGRDPRYVPNPPPINRSVTTSHGVLNTTTQMHLRGTAHSTSVLTVVASGRVSPTDTSHSSHSGDSGDANRLAFCCIKRPTDSQHTIPLTHTADRDTAVHSL